MTSVVVFASKTGNTRYVAEQISGKMAADIIDLGKEDADLSKYDEVVIGSGVYAGKLSKKIRSFLDENKDTLSEKKVSFYLCCVFKDEKGQKQLDGLMSKYAFISKKVFFSGKKKGPDAAVEIEEFVKSL